MNRIRCGIIFAAVIAILGLGCLAPEPKPVTKANESVDAKAVEQLKTQLDQARTEAARLEQEKEAYAGQARSLEARIGRLANRLKLATQRAEKAVSEAEVLRKSYAGGGADPERVKLLGEKALAEFKISKLNNRLDRLSEDLDSKEQELERIRRNAQLKDSELARLRTTLENLQKAETTRTAELDTRLNKIQQELVQRSQETERLKVELDSKERLLETLKNAASDASSLKQAADAQAAGLKKALDASQKELNEAKTKIGELTDKVKDAEQKLAGAEGQMAELRAQAQEATNKAAEAESKVAAMKTAVQEAATSLTHAGNELERTRRENAALKGQLTQSAQEMSQCRQEVARFQADLERQIEETEMLKEETAQLKAELESKQVAAEPPPQEGPSTIDLLLKPPAQRKEEKAKTPLY